MVIGFIYLIFNLCSDGCRGRIQERLVADVHALILVVYNLAAKLGSPFQLDP